MSNLHNSAKYGKLENLLKKQQSYYLVGWIITPTYMYVKFMLEKTLKWMDEKDSK